MGLLTKTDKATHAGHSNDRWTDREITMTAATQTTAIRADQSGAASNTRPSGIRDTATGCLVVRCAQTHVGLGVTSGGKCIGICPGNAGPDQC